MFNEATVFHEFAVSHDGQLFLGGTLFGDTKSPSEPTTFTGSSRIHGLIHCVAIRDFNNY